MVKFTSQGVLKIQLAVVLMLLLVLQVSVTIYNRKFVPALEILPKPESISSARLSALGDDEFYFRYLALSLQNFGNSFGRFTKLMYYNYADLYDWFMLLDQFDSKSNFVPSIASYLFSNSQNAEDNEHIVEYLEKHYDKDPENKWWWLSQAVILSLDKLKDYNLALRLSFKLSNTPSKNLPRWAQQMPAIVYLQMDKKELAYEVMTRLAREYNNYSQGELNYMNYFIKEMLGYKDKMITKKPKYNDVAPLYK